jgi:ubiquinone/menaquinone biosynthesis C-methylase UbiE
MVTTQQDPLYLMGRSDHETARLQRQAQLYGPLTRRLLIEAGVGAGMRVLDVGSGAGDVALLVAELVGPIGQVVGVDTNAHILDGARSRVEAAGWTNITFTEGDLRTASLDGVFDAVVGRFVLGFVGNRVELLESCIDRLRPGGLVVFQEHDAGAFYRVVPASPLAEQWRRWLFQLLEAIGVDPGFAMALTANSAPLDYVLHPGRGGEQRWRVLHIPGAWHLGANLAQLFAEECPPGW